MDIMQSPITLDFGKDTIIYGEQILSTGTLACLALNIPRADVERLAELAPPLRAFGTGLESESCPPVLLEPARANAHEIVSIMAKHAPFCYWRENALHVAVDTLFSSIVLDAHRLLHSSSTDIVQGDIEAAASLFSLSFRFVWILEQLGFTLGQYLDTITAFAETLDSLENRKIDGLAEAVAQYFPDVLIFNESGKWMTGMNLSDQYMARKDDKGNPVIVRRKHYVSVVGMLRADFFEGLAVGHAPKKCLNCGRWFLTLDGRHTKYCDGIDPNSEKGETCRSVGNRKRREFREKAEDNHYKKLYTTRCNSISHRVNREKLNPKIAEKAKILAKNKLNRAVWDNDYALNHYEAEMELDALIAEAMADGDN